MSLSHSIVSTYRYNEYYFMNGSITGDLWLDPNLVLLCTGGRHFVLIINL